MRRVAPRALLLAMEILVGCSSSQNSSGSGGGDDASTPSISCPTLLRTPTLPSRTADGKLELGGADLSCSALDGLDLSHANLAGADLRGASLGGTTLSEANLRGADLRDSRLFGAKLDRADATEAKLQRTMMGYGTCIGTIFDAAELSYVVSQGALDFTRASLIDAKLVGADFNSANFSEANLLRADFTDTKAELADFSLAKGHELVACPGGRGGCIEQANGYLFLPATDFVGTDLAGVDLSPLVHVDAKATGTLPTIRAYDLKGCPTPPAGLTGTFYCLAQPESGGSAFVGPGVDLAGAHFGGADLSGTRVVGLRACPAVLDAGQRCLNRITSLEPGSGKLQTTSGNVLLGPGVAFPGEDFGEFDFKGADLTDADLTNARLSAANLNGVRLAGARLDGVTAVGLASCPASLPERWVCAQRDPSLPPAESTFDPVSGAALLGPNARLGCGKGTPDLSFADLRGVDLSGAEAPLGVFDSADLSGASLRDIVASGASFANADLTNADFSGAELGPIDYHGNTCSALLSGADFTGAVLDGAIWSNTTCPDGSNSDDHDDGCAGALSIEEP